MPKQDAVDREALADLCTPWCVRVVATLRIADHVAAGAAGLSMHATGHLPPGRFVVECRPI